MLLSRPFVMGYCRASTKRVEGYKRSVVLAGGQPLEAPQLEKSFISICPATNCFLGHTFKQPSSLFLSDAGILSPFGESIAGCRPETDILDRNIGICRNSREPPHQRRYETDISGLYRQARKVSTILTAQL